MAIHRQMYRRGLNLIAVRRIQLSTRDFIEPGEIIDNTRFKTVQIQRWYNMRRVGVLGSEWANAMLADKDNAFSRPEVVGVSEAEERALETPIVGIRIEPTVKKERKKEASAAPAPVPSFNLKFPNG